MREDVARAEAREDRPVGPNFTALYVGVGAIMCFLTAYTLTIALTNVPEWIAPDVLSGALLRDMALRWQPWAGFIIGGWVGYKVSQLR